jgi:glycosyltransferase involved in cell wall biosynthesis
VRFLGERRDIPEILAAVDLLLAPSLEEPFGRTIIEAMAMRVPVVATRNGGPSEIIKGGVDGLLLPPRWPDEWARAILQLVESPELRREFGAKGREKVLSQFGRAMHVERFVEVYERLLAGGYRPVRGERKTPLTSCIVPGPGSETTQTQRNDDRSASA